MTKHGPDDRDLYRPKHQTPAAGVRAPTGGGATPTPPDHQWDEPTPPVVAADPLAHLTYRHQRLSRSVDLMQLGMRTLEAQSQAQAVEMARFGTSLQGIESKVDILVRAQEGERSAREDLAEAARLERKEREERKKEREERELKLKADERRERLANRKLTLSIVVPTLAAIGAIVAAIIAAMSGHQAPAPAAPVAPPAATQPR